MPVKPVIPSSNLSFDGRIYSSLLSVLLAEPIQRTQSPFANAFAARSGRSTAKPLDILRDREISRTDFGESCSTDQRPPDVQEVQQTFCISSIANVGQVSTELRFIPAAQFPESGSTLTRYQRDVHTDQTSPIFCRVGWNGRESFAAILI